MISRSKKFPCSKSKTLFSGSKYNFVSLAGNPRYFLGTFYATCAASFGCTLFHAQRKKGYSPFLFSHDALQWFYFFCRSLRLSYRTVALLSSVNTPTVVKKWSSHSCIPMFVFRSRNFRRFDCFRKHHFL